MIVSKMLKHGSAAECVSDTIGEVKMCDCSTCAFKSSF